MKKLFQISEHWGRGYGVEALFIATQEEVDKIIDKEIHFGEICGKHSEVSRKFTKDEISVLDVSQKTVDELFEVLGSHISGEDPLGIYEDQVADGYYDDDDEDEE